jgi:hypothetical protein
MEAVLQRLQVVVLVGRIFHDYGVVTFADFPPLLDFSFSLLRDLDFLRGRLRLGDELLQVVLQDTRYQRDYSHGMTTRLRGTATYLLWRAHGGVLRDWARRVRRHVLEDTRQPIDNVVVVDLASRHPRRVVVAGVLEAQGVAGISGCTLRFMKLKATCSALSPASLSTLMRANSSGSWIPSCIVGSVFHQA